MAVKPMSFLQNIGTAGRSALNFKDTSPRRVEPAHLWAGDYPNLVVTCRHNMPVLAAAFSADGKTILTGTEWWIHRAIIDGNKIIPQSSRLLPGRVGALHCLDVRGDKVQVAVHVTGDSIKIITVRFDNAGVTDAPPIQGGPNQLLAEWQRKLALKLKEDGKIEPYIPN